MSETAMAAEKIPREKSCAVCHEKYARPAAGTTNRKWALRRYCSKRCARIGVMREHWTQGRRLVGWWDDSQWLVTDDERRGLD